MTDEWINDIFNRRLNDLRDVSRAELRRIDELQKIKSAQLEAQLRDIEERVWALEHVRRSEGQ